jgi:DNA repair protein RadA/Sms
MMTLYQRAAMQINTKQNNHHRLSRFIFKQQRLNSSSKLFATSSRRGLKIISTTTRFFVCDNNNTRSRQTNNMISCRAASSSSSGGQKTKTRYLCQDCGEDYAQWYGQCPSCKAWDTMKVFREPISNSSSGGNKGKSGGGAGAQAAEKISSNNNIVNDSIFKRQTRPSTSNDISNKVGWVSESNQPRSLKEVLRPEAKNAKNMRRVSLPGTLGHEIERVLGGGVVPGGLVLVGGDPGVGKSTILLQLAGLLGKEAMMTTSKTSTANGEESFLSSGGVLYASGEESVEQVASRAERMGINQDGVYLYSATRLENILDAVNRLEPSALIVDSIQTVFLEDATGSPGSVSQVRECTTALLHAAKTSGMPVFIVGHVTKSGDIAGPRVLEHIVDVVLYLEGDADRAIRILRGHKNRYGSTDEVGVFQMADVGLVPVPSPSALFLGERIISEDVSAAPTVTLQGSRPFMLEIQALCNDRMASYEDDENSMNAGMQIAPAVRTAVGLKFERMQLLLAVLAKFVLGRRIQRNDIFVNVVGGLKLDDPSTDVAVAMAIASSFLERPLPSDMCFFGEVGLGGELRPVMQAERRIAEAATMGFKRVLMPFTGANEEAGKKQGMEIIKCNSLAEAVKIALGAENLAGRKKTSSSRGGNNGRK